MKLLESNSYKEVAAITEISVRTLARERRKRKANEVINIEQTCLIDFLG
ncbi:hypothetical protein [Lysinibacillus fusiformis]|nr:hypothetical protein [Lysinibacillus fusiformis]